MLSCEIERLRNYQLGEHQNAPGFNKNLKVNNLLKNYKLQNSKRAQSQQHRNKIMCMHGAYWNDQKDLIEGYLITHFKKGGKCEPKSLAFVEGNKITDILKEKVSRSKILCIWEKS
jgi:hypothetical protein